MLTSGDVVEVDLGIPEGREAGFHRPAVVVTAQRILDSGPTVAHIVPLTTKDHGFDSEVHIDPDLRNGLPHPSVAQCQHVRAISIVRVGLVTGNVGATVLTQIRDILGLILDT